MLSSIAPAAAAASGATRRIRHAAMPCRAAIAIAAVALAVRRPAPRRRRISPASTARPHARNCKQVDAAKNGEGDWTIWLCPGIGGYVVRVTEDDLRMTVSIGRDRQVRRRRSRRRSASSRPFNSIHDTLEWRTTKGAPFATIQRWFLSDAANLDKAGKPDAGRDAGRDAAQSRLPRRLCRRARQCAESPMRWRARPPTSTRATSTASNQPMVIGKRGRAIELAMPYDL